MDKCLNVMEKMGQAHQRCSEREGIVFVINKKKRKNDVTYHWQNRGAEQRRSRLHQSRPLVPRNAEYSPPSLSRLGSHVLMMTLFHFPLRSTLRYLPCTLTFWPYKFHDQVYILLCIQSHRITTLGHHSWGHRIRLRIFFFVLFGQRYTLLLCSSNVYELNS